MSFAIKPIIINILVKKNTALNPLEYESNITVKTNTIPKPTNCNTTLIVFSYFPNNTKNNNTEAPAERIKSTHTVEFAYPPKNRETKLYKKTFNRAKAIG